MDIDTTVGMSGIFQKTPWIFYERGGAMRAPKPTAANWNGWGPWVPIDNFNDNKWTEPVDATKVYTVYDPKPQVNAALGRSAVTTMVPAQTVTTW
jgi:hypothetical protein